ncbi:hypothetical protein EH165_13695 [Nakamurella antarctica]|uniref:Transcriptional attenuator, LytR family n=1 Tax=Nakamurella antarctica TaxID=1902245 RepID=A0A3G8ZPI4_9ACTN|nr:LCP family protein [Nakamurella antarctica]AZI59038.1 hypothetical protein EH165_13695 [Nakamurella antarctica]
MSESPRSGGEGPGPALTDANVDAGDTAPPQPWDRPRRWNTERMDATRVDDLLARLGPPAAGDAPRRRRRSDRDSDAAASAPSSPSAEPALTPLPESSTSPSTAPTIAATPQQQAVSVVVPASNPEEDPPSAPQPGPTLSATPTIAAPPQQPLGRSLPQPRNHEEFRHHHPVTPPSDDANSRTDVMPRMSGLPVSAEAAAVRESLRASLVSAQALASVRPADVGHPAASRERDAPAPLPVGALAAVPWAKATPRKPATTSPIRHHYAKRGASVLLALVSALVLVVTGIYSNILANGESGLAANSVDAGLSDAPPPAAVPTGALPTDAAPAAAAGLPMYPPENFLLVGSDSRTGENIAGVGDSSLDGVVNTDTMMVLHISGDRQQVSVVSLPRDLWADNVVCNDYDRSTNQYGGPSDANKYPRQHLNAFYGVGGPKCLVKAVENLTGIDITRYIMIDFAGFKSMVDSLGGITVNACGPIDDAELGLLVAQGGTQVITGTQALHLSRARNVTTDASSDISRIKRQQLILSSILRQVKSSDTLLNPAKLNDFVTAFTQATRNDGLKINDLMNLAQSLGTLDPSRVTFYTLPTGEPENDGRGSMEIDRARSDPLFYALINDLPVPGTEPAPAAATATPGAPSAAEPSAPATAAQPLLISVAPADVDLTIVNAAGRDGLAGEVAAKLTTYGYSLSDNNLQRVDDAPQARVTVEYSAGNEAAAATVAATVTGAKLVVKSGLGKNVRLVLGSSYDGQTVETSVGDSIPADVLAQIPASSAVAATTGSGSPADTSSAGSSPEPATSPEAATSAVADIAQVRADTSQCL